MVHSEKSSATLGVREVHLRDYWKVAWQGRWTVAGVFLLVVAAVAAWTFLQTPIYRAVAVVEVQPQARRVAPGQDVSGMGVASYGWFAEERYQNTQIEVIRSRAVAEAAFRSLGLKNDPRFRDAKDPVRAFQSVVRVEQRRETGLIEISVDGADRDEITRWANAVADAYVRRNLEKAQENTRNAVDAIRRQMDPLREKLSEAEKDRFELLRDKQIYNPENQKEIVRQRLTKMNEELSATQVKLGSLRSVLGEIRDLQASDGDPMSLPDLAQDVTLKELNAQKVQVEKDLDAAKVTYRPGHPIYQEKLSQQATFKARIRDQVNLILGRIQKEHDLASRNEAYLREEIRKAEETSFNVGIATSAYDMVSANAQTRRQLYDAITKSLNEITVGADLLSNNVSVLDYAIPPLAPVKPQKRLNLFLGGMFGFFLGLAAVFFLDYLDNTFRTQEDVERFLGLGTLAIVPRFTGSDTGARGLNEAFQTLRTALIFLSKNRERKVVLITSTAPQEGKSSTVAQLARTLAGAGDRVMIVDCDLRRPTQHFHLKLERENGLTNYLAAPRGFDDWRPFVKTVGPANLHAITCGPIPPNPPELLGSERFLGLIRELRGVYDWVLLDSPPSMSLADAALLAALADLSVLVIRHAETDRDIVARSAAHFRKVGANLVGVILNDVDIERAYRKDYYYAGYDYYDDGQKRKRKGEAPKPAEPRVGAGAGS